MSRPGSREPVGSEAAVSVRARPRLGGLAREFAVSPCDSRWGRPSLDGPGWLQRFVQRRSHGVRRERKAGTELKDRPKLQAKVRQSLARLSGPTRSTSASRKVRGCPGGASTSPISCRPTPTTRSPGSRSGTRRSMPRASRPRSPRREAMDFTGSIASTATAYRVRVTDRRHRSFIPGRATTARGSSSSLPPRQGPSRPGTTSARPSCRASTARRCRRSRP